MKLIWFRFPRYCCSFQIFVNGHPIGLSISHAKIVLTIHANITIGICTPCCFVCQFTLLTVLEKNSHTRMWPWQSVQTPLSYNQCRRTSAILSYSQKLLLVCESRMYRYHHWCFLQCIVDSNTGSAIDVSMYMFCIFLPVLLYIVILAFPLFIIPTCTSPLFPVSCFVCFFNKFWLYCYPLLDLSSWWVVSFSVHGSNPYQQ